MAKKPALNVKDYKVATLRIEAYEAVGDVAPGRRYIVRVGLLSNPPQRGNYKPTPHMVFWDCSGRTMEEATAKADKFAREIEDQARKNDERRAARKKKGLPADDPEDEITDIDGD